ncbi:thiazole synthase [PVC group bacterium (ex Bugula neritina AB1)]|nr:thiazole synthase [PVC group bacterium (ex Bugula neritina AB1)]
MKSDELFVGNRGLKSRLFLGTGKFASSKHMMDALEASGAEVVTMALRRVNIDDPQDSLLSVIDPSRYIILPNTAGARDADEAVRLAHIAKRSGGIDWIKLEVTPEINHLLPDGVETLKAAEKLVRDGFTVLPYIQADPLLAKRLEEVGCATVMPLGSPIGTNKGLKTRDMLAYIIQQSQIPVVVDAGLGLPSHAAEAMEMGADAVLVNTAISIARYPKNMAIAFSKAVEAGRIAYLSGRGDVSDTARASSPLTGFLRK